MVRRLRLVWFAAIVSCLPGRAMGQAPEWLSCCPAAPNAVVAVIDGEAVHVRDLDSRSRTSDPRALFELNRHLNDPRVELLRSADEERLLAAEAARLGTTVARLLNDRLSKTSVAEHTIRSAFAQIRAQQADARYEQLAPVIRAFLEGQLRAQARAQYIRELRRASK